MRLQGFSLLEIAVTLAITGLVAGFYLKYYTSSNTKECFLSSAAQMKTINGALQSYAVKNDRYPRPADRRLSMSDAQYGREATTTEVGAGAIDISANIFYGAVPFETLGLTAAFAADCWGNKFTYAVTSAYAQNGSPAGTGDLRDQAIFGAIPIKTSVTNTLLADAAYAIISHGEDGLGAVKNNYQGQNKNWCSPAGSAAIKYYNCNPLSGTVMAASFDNGKDDDNYFDDIVVYYGRPATPITGGGWSKWGPCVNGTKTRTCTDPAPANGGMPCIGPKTSVKDC